MGINQYENRDLFEEKKTKFFSKIFSSVKSYIYIHKEHLWNGSHKNKESWTNVSEHCGVVLARVEVLANKLSLSKNTVGILKKAAFLHDVFKKQEKEIVSNKKYSEPTWEAFDESRRLEDKAFKKYLEKGKYDISENIVYLLKSNGHTSLLDTKNILKKSETEDLSELEIAFLILHYVDDYTRCDEWVIKAIERGGLYENELNFRVQKNRNNPRYKRLNDDGVDILGQKTFDAQEKIGMNVEKWIYNQLLKKGPGLASESKEKQLPFIIDQVIRKKIEKILD